jgi:hypothetical protein
VITGEPFSPQEWLSTTLEQLGRAFAIAGMQVAHVKIHVTTPEGALKASLTQAGTPVSWDAQMADAPAGDVRFTINARVNGEPGPLARVVRDVVARSIPRTRLEWSHFECFSPLPPVPTFRLMPAA